MNDKIITLENLSTYNDLIKEYIKTHGGSNSAYNYKGSCLFAELPSVNNPGDVWNIEDDFTLDGKNYIAGTHVAWNGTGWDPLSGSIDLSSKQDVMQYETMPPAIASSLGKIVQYIGEDTAQFTNGYYYKLDWDSSDLKWKPLQTFKTPEVSHIVSTSTGQVIIDLDSSSSFEEINYLEGSSISKLFVRADSSKNAIGFDGPFLSIRHLKRWSEAGESEALCEIERILEASSGGGSRLGIQKTVVRKRSSASIGIIVVDDVVYTTAYYVSLNGSPTLSGNWTFTHSPSSSEDPVNDNNLATKHYVDSKNTIMIPGQIFDLDSTSTSQEIYSLFDGKEGFEEFLERVSDGDTVVSIVYPSSDDREIYPAYVFYSPVANVLKIVEYFDGVQRCIELHHNGVDWYVDTDPKETSFTANMVSDFIFYLQPSDSESTIISNFGGRERFNKFLEYVSNRDQVVGVYYESSADREIYPAFVSYLSQNSPQSLTITKYFDGSMQTLYMMNDGSRWKVVYNVPENIGNIILDSSIFNLTTTSSESNIYDCFEGKDRLEAIIKRVQEGKEFVTITYSDSSTVEVNPAFIKYEDNAMPIRLVIREYVEGVEKSLCIGKDSENSSWRVIENSTKTYVDSGSVLTKTNTTSYTPTQDYHPATKKYVDDTVSASKTIPTITIALNQVVSQDPLKVLLTNEQAAILNDTKNSVVLFDASVLDPLMKGYVYVNSHATLPGDNNTQIEIVNYCLDLPYYSGAGTLSSVSKGLLYFEKATKYLTFSAKALASNDDVTSALNFYSQNIVAPLYSDLSTYVVGDYVIYSGVLYRCTTAIPVAESWNASHWTSVRVVSEISSGAAIPSATSSEINALFE